MTFTVRTVDREFSPADAERVTGVSVALQRDWRRRDLLPKNETGKWTSYDLGDIIKLSVMKAFADAGFSVQYVADMAGMASLPTYAAIEALPGAVEIIGDEISDKLRTTILHAGTTRGARGRYLVMASTGVGGKPQIGRVEDLEQVNNFLDDCNAINCAILDFERLAQRIADRAGLPLIRQEVTKSKKGKH